MGFVYKNKYSILKLGLSVLLKRPYSFANVIRLNDDCNLRCSYCSSPEKDREVEFNSLITYLDAQYKLGCRYVVLSGGEPTMYSNIDRLLDWLNEKEFYICINTNGYEINSKRYRELILKVDEVAISLDGPKVYHDQLRGKGSHLKALKAIVFARNNFLKVSISPVLHKFNMRDDLLVYFYRLRQNHGLHIDYGIVDPRGDVTKTTSSKQIAPSEKQRTEFFKKLRQFKKDYGLYEISSELIDYMEFPKPVVCEASNFIRFLDLTGSIHPCMHVAGEDWSKVGSIEHGVADNYEGNCIECDYCSCNPIYLVNDFLKNKFSLIPLLKMALTRASGFRPRFLWKQLRR
tara:strand:+ start:50709 stop:51746 length:1038 start_codon:yes stop_codon:yes gene_type:complete